MKAAFEIFPKEENHTDTHLLVEAGRESISFILFSKAPFEIKGLLMYNLDKNLLPAEIATAIENIVHSSTLLQQSFNSSFICYNFKESLLVPSRFPDKAAQAEMLDLFFGDDTDVINFIDTIDDKSIVNVYRVDEIIRAALAKSFNGAERFHTSSLQIKKPLEGNVLSCIVYHSAIKVIFYKEGKLQLVQYFSYNTALDVAYYLLNICTQHDVKADDANILLSGMIDEQSNLYNEIYKYFLNIQFDTLSENSSSNEALLKYPSHFFSNLISMASCVS